MTQLQAVIFDWSGTTVDHGCFAPAMAFVAVFEQYGVAITIAEARAPMGMGKRDHIAALLSMTRIVTAWTDTHGTPPTDTDVERVYADFIPLQIDVIAQYARVIDGIPAMVNGLRERGLKIGSCTGYTRAMLDAVAPLVAQQGYAPDDSVTVDEVPDGRPAPWMAVQSAMNMGIYPPQTIVKVGDTVPDIDEGINAGMWTIGLAATGNDPGMTADELAALSDDARRETLQPVYDKLSAIHYVIDSAAHLLPILDKINTRLRTGERL